MGCVFVCLSGFLGGGGGLSIFVFSLFTFKRSIVIERTKSPLCICKQYNIISLFKYCCN